MHVVYCLWYCIMGNWCDDRKHSSPFTFFSSRTFHNIAMITSMIVTKYLLPRYYSSHFVCFDFPHILTSAQASQIWLSHIFIYTGNTCVVTGLRHQRNYLIAVNHWCHPPTVVKANPIQLHTIGMKSTTDDKWARNRLDTCLHLGCPVTGTNRLTYPQLQVSASLC